MLCVPSVAINVGSLKKCMMHALNSPSSAPVPIAMINATGRLSIPVLRINMMAAYAENIPTMANDTSIPPDISTISTPIAMIIMTDDERIMSKRFCCVANAGFVTPTNMQ